MQQRDAMARGPEEDCLSAWCNPDAFLLKERKRAFGRWSLWQISGNNTSGYTVGFHVLWNIDPVVLHLLFVPTIERSLALARENRGGVQLLLGDVGMIALELLVVGELVPRDGAMVH